MQSKFLYGWEKIKIFANIKNIILLIPVGKKSKSVAYLTMKPKKRNR